MTESHQRSVVGRLKFYAYIVVGVVTATTIITMISLTVLRDRVLRDNAVDSLKRNVGQQADKVLLGRLIPDQARGVDLYLESIRQAEGLDRIQVVERANVEGFDACFSSGVFVICRGGGGERVGVFAPIEEGKVKYGFLFKAKAIRESNVNPVLTYSMWIIVLVVIGSLSLALVYIFRSLRAMILDSLDGIRDGIKGAMLSGSQADLKSTYSEFRDLEASVVQLIKEHQEARREAILADIARRVAHDIRSPLTALQFAVADLRMDSDRLNLIHKACSRIREIAEDLLAKYRGKADKSAGQSLKVECLFLLVDGVVEEKKFETKSNPRKTIVLEVAQGAAGMFSRVDPGQFRRALSNLVNNALEALMDDGLVTLSLRGERDFAVIEIVDNGKGIPKGILGKIGQKYFSHGKGFDGSGNGLGVFSAREYVESWQGTLRITSEVDLGTKVEIRLPLAAPPDWSVRRIEVSTETEVVVFDDDFSFHEMWRQRFAEVGLKVTSFSSSAEMARAPRNKALWLVDLDIGEERSGLDVVRDLTTQVPTILVTANFERSDLQSQCRELGIRLLPKPLVPYVEIQCLNSGH